ncbi:hypothetical protein GOZ97_15805 [Agrobacterium vitis]|uniref:Uncharacterized protein n=1 Tax=Agrobacterium vitis TaxID=373 RepID=A0AAE2UWN7_AGRVI|nr:MULTISPECIES: hypothetical protein [Rhizobium/Agrobacterium group]MBF2715219.1 hypothetical protein [Agrobacterium vitis]MCF1433626.1 hypothetical protein [Allorhizobium ampelinum]MCF1448520.1 hypothetical protein [Allorhizobium ampelinum]MCF1494144.1 hypothetical protein [Allorhizobium ampelinum]MUO91284.1 hypothetical protein [Agrobacterium vitis]
MQYSLSLEFDTDVLSLIKDAGQRVAIAKPVGNGAPNVIWVDIDPFQVTTIEWEENYWIYASTDSVEHGVSINKLSEVSPGPALDGGYYEFTNNNIFGPFRKNNSALAVNTGTFAAINNMDYDRYSSLTFGLAQDALVNKKLHERKPISAQTVLATQSIRMTPFTYVYVWLQAEFESQTIITEIAGTPSVAKFGGSVTDIALKYDPIHGIFGQV